MSDPHIYPDPTGNSQPSAPLNLAAGNSSGFVSIQQLASTIGSDNGDAFMYIRLAMSDPAGALSGSRPMPDVILQADGGSVPHPPPVLAQGPLPLYSGNTYVADVSIVQEDVGYPNVWVIKVDFVANPPQPHTWAINIKNNDAVPRYFTWVVSGTLSLTAQPWIDVSPTSLLWEVLINGSKGESVQVTNRGTTAFTVTGITSALPPGFTVALPGSLLPGDSQPLTVTFAAPSSPPPPDGSVAGNSVVGIAPVDGVAGNIVGHNQTLSVSAKVAALEIVLLLDDSGSMTWNPAGDTLSVADQATLSRWSQLVGAVNDQFLPLLAAFGVNGMNSLGTLGIARFPELVVGDLTSFDLMNPPLPISSANIATAKLAVGKVMPFFAGTPLGDGLNRVLIQMPVGTADTYFATDSLSINANRRWLLLMTDGAQNIGTHLPQEFIKAGDAYEPGQVGTGIVDLAALKISLFAIGYGVTKPTPASNVDPYVLQALVDSSYNGGAIRFPDDDPTIATQIGSAFRDAIKSGITPSSSPGDPPSVFQAAQTQAKHFALITPFDRKAAFVLAWNTADANRLRLELITPTCEVITPETASSGAFSGVTFNGGDRSQLYVVSPDFLSNVGDPDNPRYGTWTLRVVRPQVLEVVTRKTTGVDGIYENYDYDIIVDSDLRMDVQLDRSKYFAGDPIGVSARLTAAGKPVRNAAVVLSTTSPEQSQANWLASIVVPEAALQQAAAQLKGDSSPLLVKTVGAGLAGVTFTAATTQTNIGMTDPGNIGTYRATITDTAKPESYTFYITAIGITEDGGSFRREAKVATNVLVRPDPACTRLDVRFGITGTAQAFVTPCDRFGNVLLLDPSTSSFFGLTVQNGNFTGPLTSNLDGTYTQPLKFDPTTSPVVTVLFGGQTIVTQQPLPPIGKLVWVNKVIAFTPGTEAAKGANLHANPANALGDVQTKDPGTFVSLGGLGVLTVGVNGQSILGQGGDEVSVFVEPDTDLRSYIVSALPTSAFDDDADDWVTLGTSAGTTSTFSFPAKLSAARAIRITDTSGRTRGKDFKPLSTPGVSIRAVGVKSVGADSGSGQGGAGGTCLRVRALNPQQKPLGGKVDIEFQPQESGPIVKVAGADASGDIDVSGLQRTPQGLYQVTVTPTDVFTPSSQFVTIPASGFATAVFVIGKS